MVTAAAVVVVWFAAPVLDRLFLGQKYGLSSALILATIAVGVVKILERIAVSGATALAEGPELVRLTFLGWAGLAVAIGGGVIGARWGLSGVIYGVGAGWLVRAVVGAAFAARHLREVSHAATPASPSHLCDR